jgi:hypothetical protein
MMVVDTNVFIAHAGGSFAMPLVAKIIGRMMVEAQVQSAVRRQTGERCLAAYRTLQNLPDEDWDAIEPDLVEEIAVLHELCATDKDLQ